MKKIILGLYIFIFIGYLFIFNIKKISALESNSNFYIEENINFQINKNIDNALIIDDKNIIYERSNKVYLYNNEELFLFEGHLIKCITYNSLLYVLIYDETYILYEYNMNTSQSTKLVLDDYTIEDMIIDKNIYLVGSFDDDAVILVYDLYFNLESKKCFGGSGNDIFKRILLDDNYIYLMGEKDAVEENSGFVNVGQSGEYKTFCCLLDKELNIYDVLYFDNGHPKEEVAAFYLAEGNLYALIKYGSTIYNYIIDVLEDNIITSSYQYFNLSDDIDIYESYNSKYDYVFISNYKKETFLTSNCELLYASEVGGVLYSTKVLNGMLYLLIYDNNILYETTFSEYEILKQEAVICNKLNYDYENLNNISVESIFEKLVIQMEDINPYFNKMIHGTYTINYEIERQNHEILFFSTPLIVEKYTNFIDGDIYKVGKQLLFFGYGTLDGKTIYNGDVVNDEGVHEIEITDVNGNIDAYKIRIVKDYYMENEGRNVINIPISIYLSEYQSPSLTYALDGEVEILDIYVNNQSIDNYIYQNGLLTINFNDMTSDVETYRINKIVYKEAHLIKELLINDLWTFKKSAADLKIDNTNTLNKNDSIIELKITDVSSIYRFLKVSIKGKNSVVSNYYYDESFVISLDNDNYNVDVYFCYLSSDNNIVEDNILTYQCNNIKLNVDLDYKVNHLNTITITLKHPKNKNNILTYNILQVSFLNYYKDLDISFGKKIVVISIFTFIMIIILFIIVIIMKHNKKMKSQKTVKKDF